jgi:uncharacterized protein (TIGR03067 family)
MYHALCIQALVLALASSPSDDPEPRHVLDGEWEAVGMIDNRGDHRTEDELKEDKISCSIKGSKFVLRDRGKVSEMTITVNRKASPAEIDFKMPDDKGTLEAIFKLEKGRLVICMNSSSSRWLPIEAEPGRPKSFVPGDPANRGLNAVHTITFQRKRKK